ncbi:MAG TPA: hypothetical protein GX697_01915 [Firmicutes bacterium]|nr:hypothetical protein [Bacillota bacterium]
MERSEMMDIGNFIKLARKRRSVRAYRNDKVDKEAIDRILECARWAPSGFNHQPCRYVIIRKEEDKKRLLKAVEFEQVSAEAATWGVKARVPLYMLDAAAIIAVCIDRNSKGRLPANRTGITADKIYYSNAAIAAQNIMLAAAALDLGTVLYTVGCEEEYQDMYRDALEVDYNIELYCLIPVGKPLEEFKEPSEDFRKPVKDLLIKV